MSLHPEIDATYRAFAAIAQPTQIDTCPCCMKESEIEVLLFKPLREITPDELSSYASKVLLTVGSISDFRYFIPRILEISLTSDRWWPDFEVVCRALSDASWKNWSNQEQSSITGLFHRKFELLLSEANWPALDSFLCGLSRAKITVQPLLEKIANVPPAVLGLYEQNAAELSHGRLSNAFWEDDLEGMALVVNWFFSEQVSAIIFESYGIELGQKKGDEE